MQPVTSSSKAAYSRISLFFFVILMLAQWGFYKTYIRFFPFFANTRFKAVHHFHGVILMVWMSMLIFQPLFIRSGKISIHRMIGKLSFIVAPLVVISMFVVTKINYDKPMPFPHIERVAGLALQIPECVEFILFYCLAITNRHNTYNHMRYMIGTALIMIPPGLGRVLIVYYHVPFPVAVNYCLFYVIMPIVTAFLLNDMVRRKSYKANAIIFMTFFIHVLLWGFRHYQPWQGIGEFVVNFLF